MCKKRACKTTTHVRRDNVREFNLQRIEYVSDLDTYKTGLPIQILARGGMVPPHRVRWGGLARDSRQSQCGIKEE